MSPKHLITQFTFSRELIELRAPRSLSVEAQGDFTMAKIIKIERLTRCESDTAPTTSPTKGAGIVVRSSELRSSAPIEHLPAGYEIRLGLAVADRVRDRLARERRLLRRKGIFSVYGRVVSSLPRTMRPRAWF